MNGPMRERFSLKAQVFFIKTPVLGLNPLFRNVPSVGTRESYFANLLTISPECPNGKLSAKLMKLSANMASGNGIESTSIPGFLHDCIVYIYPV